MIKVMKKILSGNRISSIGKHNFSSTKSLIDVTVNDKTGISTVTMNNPPVNAMTLEFMTSFCNVLDSLEHNKTRGMILTSALNSVFCAGLNINEFHKPDKDRLTHYYSTLQELQLKLFSSSFTTLAAINGHAPAGGCMLSITTEYRIMRNNFTIGLNEVLVGLVAPAWLMRDMAATITPRRAEMALNLGTLFSTEEALKIGLIDEIVMNNEELMTRAENVLNKFNKIDPRVRSRNKNVYKQKMIKEFDENRERDRDTFVANVLHSEAQTTIEGYLKMLKNKNK